MEPRTVIMVVLKPSSAPGFPEFNIELISNPEFLDLLPRDMSYFSWKLLGHACQ